MAIKNKLLVFVGPDGSGKTTTIHKIISRFPKNQEIRINHIRFNKIPRAGDLKKAILSILKLKLPKPNKASKSTLDSPDKLHIYGPYVVLWKIIIILSYEFIDYMLGYFEVFDTKNEKIIIFDRYIYDYYTEKDWSNTPKWIMKLLMRLIPKPDYIFFMKNEAEIIHERKKELQIKDIEIINRRIISLLELENNFIQVDTNKDPEEIAENIMEFLK